MPRIIGAGSKRLRATVLVVILALAFTPLSRVLLRAVDGSFAPVHYTSLALIHPALVTGGIASGTPIRLELVNHSGRRQTYHLRATQGGSLLSLGTETVQSGQKMELSIPTLGARSGHLEIRIAGTHVFVTVPIEKP